VRIALIANEASGGGLDHEPLADTMRRLGAEVRAGGCDPDDLEGVVAWAPERIAVAGGDGTVGTAAELREGGMERITVEHRAYELVVG